MDRFDYLIIGGGVAGTTAAETIRQRDAAASVAIVSDEPHRLYSRVMLSKPQFFLEKIPFDSVWLKKPEWYDQRQVTLLSGRSAVGLDPEKKAVTLDDGTELGYGKLLLALGCKARKLPVPGADRKGVNYLRTIDDAKEIIARVKEAKRAVTVGGGFISFEMCEMLRLAGLEVTNVLRERYFWEPVLDEVSGCLVEEAMEAGGVDILRQTELKEIVGEDGVRSVVLKDGREIPCDMVIIGIGACLSADWLKEAGLEVGHGIWANEYLETNLPDVWAAGDVAEFNDLILGERIMCGTWVNAQVQGRHAAAAMTGERQEFRLVSYYTAHGFGMNIGFIGDVMPGPDRMMISRGTPDTGSMVHLLIKDGEIIGATLINRNEEIGAIVKLVEQDVKVEMHLRELSDSDFDLKSLLPQQG